VQTYEYFFVSANKTTLLFHRDRQVFQKHMKKLPRFQRLLDFFT